MFRFLFLPLFFFIISFGGKTTPLMTYKNKPFILVIDAGHGGHDAGAVGKITTEKMINLNVALAFGKLVEQNCRDVKVVYTRTTDVFIPLQKRAEIANNAKADLFISVHTNSLPAGRIAYGSETYTLGMARAGENLDVAKRENSVILYEKDYKTTYSGFDPKRAESYIIFELMQDQYMKQSVDLAKKIQHHYVTHAGRKNKGVHQAGFLVLRATSMPSVLTELGFISTPEEETFLASSEGVRRMSQSLFKGFLAYKQEKDNVKYLSTYFDNTDNSQEEQKTISKKETPQPTPIQEEKTDSSVNTSSPSLPLDTINKKLEPAKSNSINSTTNDVIFKLQIFVSSTQLSPNDSRIKNLKNVSYYQENNLFKYTAGESQNLKDIVTLQNELKVKYPGCFPVAFQGNKRITIAEAQKNKLSKEK